MTKATRPTSGRAGHDRGPRVHQHLPGISRQGWAMGDNAADDVFDWAARAPDRALFSRRARAAGSR